MAIMDVIDLRDFYSPRLGIVARRADQPRYPAALGRCQTAGACSASAIRRPISACFADLRALHHLHAGGPGRAEMADRRGRRWRP